MLIAEYANEQFEKYGDEISNAELIAKGYCDDAAKYPLLYHCTDERGLLGILSSRKIWLTRVGSSNDVREQKEIADIDYQDRVFTASFFRDKNIKQWMWDEYGSRESRSAHQGILLSIRQEWIGTRYEVVKESCSSQGGDKIEITNVWPESMPYNKHLYVVDRAEFVSVEYFKDISQSVRIDMNGSYEIPKAVGITKKEIGVSNRTNLTRKWCEEQEIRFRVILNPMFGDGQSAKQWIDTVPVIGNTVPFDKICVNFTDNAFDAFEVVFDPEFPEEQKGKIINELKRICNGAKITFLDSLKFV